MDEKAKACDNECKLSEEEREWIHTARKYVNSRHLPMLGTVLKALDDTAYFIGKAVLLTALIGSGVLLVMWLILKLK